MKRVFANIGFSVAVTLIVLNFMNIKAALAALIASSVAFVVCCAASKAVKGKAIMFCLLGVLFSSLLFVSFYYGNYLPQTKLFGKTASVKAYVVDLPQKSSSGKYVYKLKTKSVSGENVPQNIKFELYSDSPLYLKPYELADMKVSFIFVADNAYDSHGKFDDNIFLCGYSRDYSKTGESVNSPNKFVLDLRSELKRQFGFVVKNNEGALSYAVLTGDKSLLSYEANTDFRLCGASHLMAVSGLHMSVLFGVLYSLLKKLLVPKCPRVVICSAGILFYIMLSGFSKSMIRCGIMMLVFLIGKLIKKKTDSLNSLGFAAFIVCLNPYAVTDVGAQLTFCAVLGLITISPHIQSKIKVKNKIVSYFIGIVCASISAVITTIPSMLFNFGFVSMAGIFSNLLLIPLATALLVFAALFSLLSFVPAFAWLFGNLCWFASHAMLKLAEAFSCSFLASLTVGGQKFFAAVCAVFLLFGISFIIKAVSGSAPFKACALLSAALAVSITAIFGFSESSSICARVVAGEESSAVVVYDNNVAVVYGLRDYEQYYKIQRLAAEYNLDVECVVGGDAEIAFAFANRNKSKVITPQDISKIKKYNVPYMKSANLTVDLKGDVVVKYNSDKLTVSAGGTDIIFDDSALDCPFQIDSVYVINKNGCVQKGVNKWAD